MIKFFTKEEEQSIIHAIQQAESKTSGEIRVHIDSKLEGDILKEGTNIFTGLKMNETELRNGILILIAPKEKKFAIIGDEGIHQKVGDDFWQAEKDLLQSYFRKNQRKEGICEAINRIGDKLKTYFPVQADDKNELPDEISYN